MSELRSNGSNSIAFFFAHASHAVNDAVTLLLATAFASATSR